MRTWFHIHSMDEPTSDLIDPRKQWSRPWNLEHGKCEKCNGRGQVRQHCLSCFAFADEDCPSCGGRVSFMRTCPVCLGCGEIQGTVRRGVSVFPTLAGLYRYLVRTNAEVVGKEIVELVGAPAREPDLDAEMGAFLIYPQVVLSSEPVSVLRLVEARKEKVWGMEMIWSSRMSSALEPAGSVPEEVLAV